MDFNINFEVKKLTVNKISLMFGVLVSFKT